jgi:hypothetical protein
MKIKTWKIEAQTGYKPFTTFYEDFSIADAFGVNAIIDTYKQAFKEWKHDYKYITEFIMALNWKIHEHYGSNDEYAEVYDELWREADEWAMDNLKGEELQYYLEITD